MRRSSIAIIIGLIGIFLLTIVFDRCRDVKVDNDSINPESIFLGVSDTVVVKDTIHITKAVPSSYHAIRKPCEPTIKEVRIEVPVIQEKIVEVETEVFIEVPVIQEKIVEVIKEVEVFIEVPIIDPEVTAWLLSQIANVKLTEDHKFALYGNSGVYSLPDRKLGWNFGFTGHYRGVEGGIAYDPINQYYQARIGYRIFQTKEKEDAND